MSKQSDRLVDLFFDDLPYAEETTEAKRLVRARLSEMNGKLSFSAIAETYSSLEKLAVLAGYTPEDAARWKSLSSVIDQKTAIRLFRKSRWLSYLSAGFVFFAFSALLRTILFAASRDASFFRTLTLFLLSLISAVALFLAFGKALKEQGGRAFAADAFLFLRDRSNQYVKRLFNSIAFLIAAFFVFEMTELDFYFFGNSKSAELAESVLSNYLIVAIPLFAVIKNALILRVIREWTRLPERSVIRSHLFLFLVCSVLYWAAAMCVLLLLGKSALGNASPYVAGGYLFLVAIYNLTLRKNLTHHNLVLNKIRVAVYLVLGVIGGAFFGMNRDTWYTQPYINSVSVVQNEPSLIAYNEETGVYTMTMNGDSFKILHLTDIHLGGSLFSRKKDLLALKACYREIEYTRPDLVIVTGDLCFPMGVMSLSFNNSAPVHQFAAFMRNVSVPWAFTFGNHDTESLASMKKEDLVEVYKSLSFKTSGTLLYPYVQPRITGRNNQLIEVRNADGSMNTALFLIDSNAYTGEGFNTYDYIHDDQVLWYENEVKRMEREEGRTVPSLAFFHIPLHQYKTAYELYLAGSDEVQYHFGENKEMIGHIFSLSAYDSAIFDKMVELGSTTGTFCGHDHYNNASISYRGIRLTYGMSIDYLAMPGISKSDAQRGAELITLASDGSWDVAQIPLRMITEESA